MREVGGIVDSLERASLRLKLDLHTHCYEATGYAEPTAEVVGEIVAAIEARGLDGIAITEHRGKEYSHKVKEIVDYQYGGRVMIIPGSEIHHRLGHVVELYLSDGIIFRFLAHPGRLPHLSFGDMENIHGIEIDNDLHNYHIDKQRVREIAKAHGLLLLSNSDAHELSDIGRHYNLFSLQELRARAISTLAHSSSGEE